VRALLVLAALAVAAHAQATASLVAGAESVAPGGTIRVGVQFQLDPHWHVYWKNPGDSGQAPSIRWRLPEGVTASEIAWPAPKRIPTPPFMTFGYEGEVTLSCGLAIPEGYAAATLLVAADVEWLMCDANGCMPGEAKLSMEIPVRPDKRLMIGPPVRVLTLGVPIPPTGPVSARYGGKRIALTAPGAPSYFFPEEPGIIEPSAEQRRTDRGILLPPVKKPVTTLRGVLAFDSGPAWAVEVPVEPDSSGNRLNWILVGCGAAVLLLAAARMLVSRKERTA
jgi:thiol:disulfide interchange protein DsbD